MPFMEGSSDLDFANGHHTQRQREKESPGTTEQMGTNRLPVPELGAGPVKEDKEMLPITIPGTALSKEQYQCRICDAIFSKRWNCLSHMKAHVRVRPVFNCPSCGKKCSKQSELDIHIRIHTGEKPYRCTVCQRCFVRQGQLNSHMRSHTGAKPFLCIFCGAAFASVSNLKRHQLQHGRSRKENEIGVTKLFETQFSSERKNLNIRELNGNAVNTSQTATVLYTPTVTNDIAMSQNPELVNSSLRTNITANSGSDLIYKDTLKHAEDNKGQHGLQFIPQPIKPIPALIPPQNRVIIVGPSGEAFKDTMEITDPLPQKYPEEKKQLLTESALSAQNGHHQTSDVSASWLTEAVQADGRRLNQTPGTMAESANEVLSKALQMDWSFLLEDAELHMQEHSAEHVGHQSEDLSLNLVADSAQMIGSSSSFKMAGCELPLSSSIYQTQIGGAVPERTAPVSVVQQDIPTASVSPEFFLLKDSVLKSNPVTLAHQDTPTIVPIPHIPAMSLNSTQQVDVGELYVPNETDSNGTQIHRKTAQLDRGQSQMMELIQLPTDVDTKAAPVLVILKQLYSEQQFQEEISTADDGDDVDDDDDDGSMVPGESTMFPQQHLMAPLPPFTASSDSNSSTMSHQEIYNDDCEDKSFPHKKQQPKIYSCDVCSQTFARQWYLTVHRNAHFRPKTFACDVCSTIFTRMGNLNRHKLMHTGAKPFQCGQCSAKFASKYRMIEHERRHEGLKPYECKICHSCFTDCSSLRRHQATHRGENLEFTCETCGAGFRTMHSLAFHLKMHPSNNSSSTKDGIAFDHTELTLSDLPIIPVSEPRAVERATKLDKPYVLKLIDKEGCRHYHCSVCSKSFPFSAACRQHILCHTGSRPFSCTDCGARFSRKACAKRHMRVHRRAKRHQCKKCDQKFQTRPRLVLHGQDHLPPQGRTVPCDECSLQFSEDRFVRIHKGIYHRRHKLQRKRPIQEDDKKRSQNQNRVPQEGSVVGSVTPSNTVLSKDVIAGGMCQQNIANSSVAESDSGKQVTKSTDTTISIKENSKLVAEYTKNGKRKDEHNVKPDFAPKTSDGNRKKKNDLTLSHIPAVHSYTPPNISYTSIPCAPVLVSEHNASTRPQRAAARNQRQFLASILTKHKARI